MTDYAKQELDRRDTERTKEQQSIFERLSQLDISKHVKKLKGGKDKDGNDMFFSYLSWADCWFLLKTEYPNATYTILESERVHILNGQPVVEKAPYFASSLGILVKVAVIIGQHSHIVQLPVLDPSNNAMKEQSYEITRKKRDNSTYTITVQSADMSDINNTIMRALVKACALFGLGLNLYQGEDLVKKEEGTTTTTTLLTSESSGTTTVSKPSNRPAIYNTQEAKTQKVVFDIPFDLKDTYKLKYPNLRFDKDLKKWYMMVDQLEADNYLLNSPDENGVTCYPS